MEFALLSLALSILIGLGCYGIVAFVATVGQEGTPSGFFIVLIGFAACVGLIGWGIWFIAHRWPSPC